MPGLENVDVNLLVALGALLEERNLTHAGERINLSQPAMSGALSRLRRHFDDELLVRVGRGYELSTLATALRPKVLEALAQIARTLEASESFDAATSTRTFSISISDYALTVLSEPLRQALKERAPGVDVDFDPLPTNDAESATALLRRDLLIAGARLSVGGRRQALFRDRFVCIAAAGNERVVDGKLSLEALSDARHAVGSFGPQIATPADLALAEAGVTPRVAVTVAGLLPLPFLVSRTDLVAFVPERLALRCKDALGLWIVETPVPPAPLIETAHWNPMNSSEAGLIWLLGVLREVSGRIRDIPPPMPAI